MHLKIDDGQGSVGYFLSGGLAGGVVLIKPEDWFLKSLAALLQDPYAPASTYDPLDVHALRLFNESQDQIGVADQRLDTPLRVRVENASGRPVVGAQVRFRVVLGGGSLHVEGASGTQLTATTDQFGIASVDFQLGQRFQMVMHVAVDGAQPQAMGMNLVNIEAASRTPSNFIAAGEDYRALARPGPAQRLVFTALPNYFFNNRNYLIPGLGYGTLRSMPSTTASPTCRCKVSVRPPASPPEPLRLLTTVRRAV